MSYTYTCLFYKTNQWKALLSFETPPDNHKFFSTGVLVCFKKIYTKYYVTCMYFTERVEYYIYLESRQWNVAKKKLFELSIDNLWWTILFMKWKRCDLYAIKQAYILCAVLCKFSIDYRCGFISYSLVNLIKNRFAGFLWEDVVAESNVLKQLWRTFYLHTLFFLIQFL